MLITSFFFGTRSVGPYGWCAKPCAAIFLKLLQPAPLEVRLKRLFRHSHLRKNSVGPIDLGARPTGASSPTRIFASGTAFARSCGTAAFTRSR